MFRQPPYNPTDPQFIAANRRGELTAEQRIAFQWAIQINWAGLIASLIIVPLVFAGALFAIWTTDIRRQTPLFVYLLILGFFGFIMLIATIPQVWNLVNVFRARRDLNERVEMLDGQMRWLRNQYVAEVPGRRLRLLNSSTGLLPGSYRFYFLPNTGWLLAAERVTPPGGDDPRAELLNVLAQVHGFNPEALEVNRQGRLAFAQQFKLFLAIVMNCLWFSLAVAFIGFFAWLIAGSARQGNTQMIILLVGGAIAIAVLLFFLWKIAQLGIDMVRGQAALEEGAAQKTYTVTRTRHGTSITHYYQLGKLKFKVSKAAYNALVEGAMYRLYYAPLSKTLIAIEPI